jgi:hypothetical protein
MKFLAFCFTSFIVVEQIGSFTIRSHRVLQTSIVSRKNIIRTKAANVAEYNAFEDVMNIEMFEEMKKSKPKLYYSESDELEAMRRAGNKLKHLIM